MEIVRSQRKTTAAAADAVPGLSLYRSAPSLEVRLEVFELYAIDRLRVLKGISDGLSRGKKSEEMEKLVNELWRANMKHQDSNEVMNKDVISHFVLRLVYCRTEDLRKWFLSMETTLFRYRFRHESSESQRTLMNDFNIPYKTLSHAEYESVKDKLSQVARSMGQLHNADTMFFKVFFEEVPELVASRKVFMLKGYAYVTMNQVTSLVVPHFRSHLSKALALTNRKWMSTIREQEKDRLTPIVEALSTSYLGPDYSQPNEIAEISLKDIYQLANSSFPLCMRHLFEKLRENHHLKHGGRMQLGLFLKEVKFQPILKIVDKGWQDQMHRPLHLAGFFLNPSLYFKAREKDEASCGKFETGFFSCFERMVPDLDHQDKIGDQVTMYLNERGIFGRELAIRARGRRMPIEWWVTYGGETPELKSIAIRILGLCCSASGCERNWSTFEFGVGLNLDDALAFWREEFRQKIGTERFDKEYAYSIRHNYGKEGKRTDYTPYSCQKIISSTPGVGDHHGCPYRHFSEENLRAALGRMGVGGRPMDDIMDKVRNRHYQLACTITFETIHASSCDAGINHPNQYFSYSQKILQAKNGHSTT